MKRSGLRGGKEEEKEKNRTWRREEREQGKEPQKKSDDKMKRVGEGDRKGCFKAARKEGPRAGTEGTKDHGRE